MKLYRLFQCLLYGILIISPVRQAVPPDPGDGSGITAADFVTRQGAALLPWERDRLDQITSAPRYSIHARLDAEKLLVDGSMEVFYTNQQAAPIDDVVFNLPANNSHIYGGVLQVSQVSRNGKRLAFSTAPDQSYLTVRLDLPVKPGEAVVLDLDFTTSIPASPAKGYGILGKARRSISLAGWYPILAVQEGGEWQPVTQAAVGDAVDAETSLYEAWFDLPADYRIVSTGIILARQTQADRQTVQLVSGPARELAMVVGPQLEMNTGSHGMIQLGYASLPADEAQHSPQEGLQIAGGVMQAYEAHFGAYPYTELDLVEGSIDMGGYEFPGMVIIDYSERVDSPLADFRWILAHEIAHQWWYGLVGNDEVANPWLDEALATYSVVYYYEDVFGKDKAQGLVGYYRGRAKEATRKGAIFTEPTTGFSDWLTYNESVYYQGAVFLDDLRHEMGDTAFSTLLKEYAAQYQGKLADPKDFLNLAQKTAGKDLSSFLAAHYPSTK